MIDTNELMLGNKLYYDNGALVKVVDVDHIESTMVNTADANKFNPIPLTDDFGLTYLDNSGIPAWRRWYLKHKFKFVHRLQNYLFINKIN